MKASLADTRPFARDDAVALDEKDELAWCREEFDLPAGIIYLDGNSLGPLLHAARRRLSEMVDREWGQGLIRSWNSAGWFAKPGTLGDALGRLIGAGPGETLVCDSTSVNLLKVLVAALRLNAGRPVIVSEAGNFPTDAYIMQGAQELFPGAVIRLAGVDGPLESLIDERVAVVALSHVDYRSGAMHDMAATTRRAHDSGALIIWDLSHSVGALPLDLPASGVDFAVGCTYKYLNAGPGGPAFLYVARRHQERARQPLTGWMGHAHPFAFSPGYEPDAGIRRFLCGTPPILSFAPLEASLALFGRVDMNAIRAKSIALGDLFIRLADERCAPFGVEVASPRDGRRRGSQVSLRHPDGYAIVQAAIDRGVIGDFRAPDLLRFGFTPLFISYAEVFDAVAVLEEILRTGAWRDERYSTRKPVT